MLTSRPPAAGRRRLTLALLWVVPLVWSSNYLIARAATGVIQPHMLALARWSLAFAIMLLVMGALGMWFCGAFVYIGGQTTSSTNIALIHAPTPIAIAIAMIGAVTLKERRHASQIAGVALALAAGLSWTACSVLLKAWPSRLGSADRLVAITAGGILVLLPFTALEWMLLPPLPFTAQALGLVVAAAVLPGIVAYQAYSFMLRELAAGKTALVLYLGPVHAGFTAWALLGEPPQWFHAVGAALLLPSIWVATRAR